MICCDCKALIKEIRSNKDAGDMVWIYMKKYMTLQTQI